MRERVRERDRPLSHALLCTLQTAHDPRLYIITLYYVLIFTGSH